jgi:4-amino-4-deoxy-L-arabinose transferase-like glycosyltransferase
MTTDPARPGRAGLWLALVIVAGAALRFATLDVQSLWYDEAVTAQLLRMDLSGLLHAIGDSESTPPLYYVLGWLWAQLFGTGEAGLRSLPALLGTATIPVAWALGRRLGGDRAALVGAGLVALNPLLVWFSQEARAYALLALLAALAALLWLRALERPSAGRAALWSVVAALAVATHYYAIFLVAPQAVWLVLRAREPRARAAALAPLGIALAALAPLALGQRANDSAAFIRDSSLLTRVVQVPKQMLVGYDAPAEVLLGVLACLLLALAAGGAWLLVDRGASGPARDDALRLAGVVAAALVLPVLAALAGEDHLITRNLLAAAPIGAALAGAGMVAVAERLPALGRGAIAAACVLALVAIVGVDGDAALQRDDWRGAVRALGHSDGERLVVASPASALAPLNYYLPTVHKLTQDPLVTNEIDYVALPERSPGERPKPPRPARAPEPVAGFVPAARVESETFTVLRLRAAVTQGVPRSTVTAGLDGKPPALLVAVR